MPPPSTPPNPTPGLVMPGPDLVQGKKPRGGSLITRLWGYLFGLGSIAIVGFLLGATMNQWLISHSQQYFGNFSDLFSYVIFLPVATVVFAVGMLVTGNRWLLGYPLLAFSFGQSIVKTDFSQWLANSIPVLPLQPQYNEYLAGVTLAYIVVYLLVSPFVALVFGKSEHRKSLRLLNAGLLVFGFVAIVCAALAGPKLLTDQQEARSLIRVPKTAHYYGEPPQGSNTSMSYGLHYTSQLNTAYSPVVNEVLTTNLKKWWVHDTHANCGDQITSSTGSAAQSYHTTKSGVVYAEAVFDRQGSQPATPETAYKEYKYCFVADYQRYTLTRSSQYGSDYLNKYPAADVIEAITDAKTIKPCKRKPNSLDCTWATNPFAITENTPPIPRDIVVSWIESPSRVSHEKYAVLGQLAITGWGVTLPLNRVNNDAYYAPSYDVSGKLIPTAYNIGLHSLDTDECFAGTRKGKDGKDIRGQGIAAIARIKLSSIKSRPSYPLKGVVVGDYLYSSNALVEPSCSQSWTADQRKLYANLTDAFQWSLINLK